MSYTLGSAAEFGVRHRPAALHRSKYWDNRMTEVIVGETEFRKFKLRKLFEASNVVADDEADGQELVLFALQVSELYQSIGIRNSYSYEYSMVPYSSGFPSHRKKTSEGRSEGVRSTWKYGTRTGT